MHFDIYLLQLRVCKDIKCVENEAEVQYIYFW